MHKASIARWREYAGLLFLTGISLFSCYQAWRYVDPVKFIAKINKQGRIPPDAVTRNGNQYACLHGVLSVGEVVGFITSVAPEQHSEIYLQAQYALAPVLVADSLDYPRVIGYFPSGSSLDSVVPQGFEVVRDCKSGVVLLKATHR